MKVAASRSMGGLYGNAVTEPSQTPARGRAHLPLAGTLVGDNVSPIIRKACGSMKNILYYSVLADQPRRP